MNLALGTMWVLAHLIGTMGKKKTGAKAPTVTMEPATLSESRGVRYLHLGTPWIQGAMRRSRPFAIELEYVRRMMVWLLLVPPESLGRAADDGTVLEGARGHAVQLGLGAAAITKFTRLTLGMQTTAVELNPTVIDACRMWFALPPDDELLTVMLADAAAFVADAANAGTARVLTVDLYDHEAASPVLDDVGFYRGCHDVLAPGGIMTVNLFGREASFAVSASHIESAFGAGNVWSLPPNRDGNTIVVGGKDVSWPDKALLAERAQSLEARFGFPATTWARMLEPLPIIPGALLDSHGEPMPKERERSRERRKRATDRAETER